MPPLVAVVGRANVGKSTLVNRMVGKRAAIEHPEPGVTRDRKGFTVTWRGVPFTLVDTGGWEPRAKGLAAQVLAQAERAAREAQLILMVVDSEVGITADDQVVAKGLRRADVPVLVVANKVDSGVQEASLKGLERLGLGPPVPVSALHGRRSGDLLDLIVEHVRDVESEPAQEEGLAIAIVGRPNVGKSSLFNRLVGEERSIVHDQPGTTRDTVDTVATVNGEILRFIDTAGMRRRAKDASGPEYYGLVRSLRAIDESDVVIHVIDAGEGPTEQDQKIARRVADAGRACILVLNKWDEVDTEDPTTDVVADTLDLLRFVMWAPILRTSAKTGRGLKRIIPAVGAARTAWEQRIPTAMLNSWLRDVVDRVPLGDTARARPTKIRYMTQARTKPPTFVVFASGTVTQSAQRALERRVRERFGFVGTPIRFSIRTPPKR